jgi:hypothetical protein
MINNKLTSTEEVTTSMVANTTHNNKLFAAGVFLF